MIGRERQSWHQPYSSRYGWGNLGNSLNPLSFLKCEVGRGQWWVASKVTDAKLCEGPIHVPVPPHVLCGENSRSTANTLPSSGSGPKSPLTGVYYKHRFPSGYLPAQPPCQWLPSTPRTTLGFLAPGPDPTSSPASSLPCWPPFWGFRMSALSCLISLPCCSPARIKLCRPTSLSYLSYLPPEQAPLSLALRAACSRLPRTQGSEDSNTSPCLAPLLGWKCHQTGQQLPTTHCSVLGPSPASSTLQGLRDDKRILQSILSV